MTEPLTYQEGVHTGGCVDQDLKIIRLMLHLSKSPSQIISVGVPNVRSFIRVGFAQLINEYFTSACLASISLCDAFVY